MEHDMTISEEERRLCKTVLYLQGVLQDASFALDDQYLTTEEIKDTAGELLAAIKKAVPALEELEQPT
jgi:hypothetical protein